MNNDHLQKKTDYLVNKIHKNYKNSCCFNMKDYKLSLNHLRLSREMDSDDLSFDDMKKILQEEIFLYDDDWDPSKNEWKESVLSEFYLKEVLNSFEVADE